MTVDPPSPKDEKVSELLPCPFCGDTPDASDPQTFYADQGLKRGHVVCCCSGPEVWTGYEPLEHWRSYAIDAWNTRAISKVRAPGSGNECPECSGDCSASPGDKPLNCPNSAQELPPAADVRLVQMAAERLSCEAQSSSLTPEGAVLRGKMKEIAASLFAALYPDPPPPKADQ